MRVVRLQATKYTKDGPGTPGGSSWTPEWLHFDNSYFKDVQEESDPELLVLATDRCLFEDEGFRCDLAAVSLRLAQHRCAFQSVGLTRCQI